jgi:hypothetical protein
MLSAVEETPSTQPNQPNASTLQEPRNDLQPTGNTGASSQTGSPQTVPQVPQDQLRTDQLRVGDSPNTIQNTTSTPPNFFIRHDYLNAAWLWMIVPVVLAILLFRPRKASRVDEDASITTATEVEAESEVDMAPKAEKETTSQPKPTTAAPTPKKPKKKKAKSKKR